MATRLIQHDDDAIVYQDTKSLVRFFSENNGTTWEIALEKLKFGTFEEAAAYAARQ